MQTVMAIIVVAAAAGFAIYRIARFFMKPDEHACSPDRCASCPLAKEGCTPERPKK